MWKSMALSSWGRLPYAPCEAARPERLSQLRAALSQTGNGTVIAYGAGRSYGDCSINESGHVVMMERLDRILAFDAEAGEVETEAGVTIRTLLDVFLPRGFVVPVCPGTAFVTVGGAIANDIHGKNHETDGSFADHVVWFDLMLPGGETVRVSRQSDAQLFDATMGGIGLTGIVVAARLKLQRVPSNALVMRQESVPNLERLLATFAEHNKSAIYAAAWFDAMAGGRDLGRGIVETAVPSSTGLAVRPGRKRAVPIDLPGFVLNPLSIGLFNSFHYRGRSLLGRRERVCSYDSFLFPLDSVLGWNRMYGKRGFRQFQCVVPAEALVQLLTRIGQSRAGSFLAVLKGMGSASTGMLSFPMPGYVVALDFPNKPGLVELLGDLERITLDHGGRVYLAKDSCLSAKGFAAMYPRLPQFIDVLERVDPQRRLSSTMSRRLAIRGGTP